IEAAARRPAAEAVADPQEACERLARAWAAMPAEAWARPIDSMGTEMPASEAPVSRLVEVEVHHADLGLDYRPRHWPPVWWPRCWPT
ncbi:MAG: maleylpyruvate isomerase N-terminal domain-containing protein, partial [Actinomycetota bacterium]|nr:maleylpyruvate isomerase N-terminal domain-containing protein [Actinomycetota bacterium]